MNKLMVQRVLLGIELLDIKMPLWRDSIDWKNFDIEDDRKCVLGQLAGGDDYYGREEWFEVYGRLTGFTEMWAWRHGFCLSDKQAGGSTIAWYWYRWQLNRVWRHYGPQGGVLS